MRDHAAARGAPYRHYELPLTAELARALAVNHATAEHFLPFAHRLEREIVFELQGPALGGRGELLGQFVSSQFGHGALLQ